MTKTKTMLQQLGRFQRLLFWSFAGIAGLFLCLYIYFVLHSISMVFTRTDLERQISTLQSNLSDLELQYVNRKDALTLEVARELGFQPTSKKNFITKKGLTEVSLTVHVQ